MEGFGIVGSLGDTALLLGLSATRIAVALLLVPLFTADLIPAMVRNAMFLAIAFRRARCAVSAEALTSMLPNMLIRGIQAPTCCRWPF